MTSRLRLDDLVGKRVRDEDGRVLGRLFDARGEVDGDDLVIVEYHVGSHALAKQIGFSLLRMLGIDRAREPLRIPWDELDLGDPDRPVFRKKQR